MLWIVFSSFHSLILVAQRVNDSSGSVDTSSSVVLLMVRDAYANYVVQTTLDVVAEGEEKRLLIEELNAHSTQLVSPPSLCIVPALLHLVHFRVMPVNTFFLQRNYTFAKHIVTKLSS
jgi:pumilio RNA-binding family